jgi:integrase
MKALADWIAAAGIESGPLFRSVPKGGRLGGQLHPGEVARIFKKMASQAGLKAKGCARISGHSSRVGAACGMAAAGLGMAQIQQAGGWRTAEMISRYTARIEIRRGGAAQLAAVQGRG